MAKNVFVCLERIGGRSMTDKKEFDMTDIGDIASEWKNVNWDLIQRMRFMNADAEIDPEDGYSEGKLKFKGDHGED